MGIIDNFIDHVRPDKLFNATNDVWNDFTGVTGQREANKTNIKLQKAQQDWEAMMSNTAIQRRQADLAAAGINPLLAAGGSGADVPNVSPARVESETAGRPEAISKIAGTVFGGLSTMLMKAQTRKTEAEAKVTEATTSSLIGRAGAEVDLLKAQIDNIQNDTDLKFWGVANEKIRGRLLNMDVEQRSQMIPLLVRELEAATREKEAGVPAAEKRAEAWRSILGTFAAHAELLIPTVNSAIGAGALGQIGKFLKPGAKVKGGLPKHITDQMKKGSKSKYGSFDKSTGEIFGR